VAPKSAPARQCILCEERAGEIEVSLGPIFALVCKPCAQPVWHAVGFMEWITKKLSKVP
jgi:hypothetical protein